jgi:hypothetical protein
VTFFWVKTGPGTRKRGGDAAESRVLMILGVGHLEMRRLSVLVVVFGLRSATVAFVPPVRESS